MLLILINNWFSSWNCGQYFIHEFPFWNLSATCCNVRKIRVKKKKMLQFKWPIVAEKKKNKVTVGFGIMSSSIYVNKIILKSIFILKLSLTLKSPIQIHSFDIIFGLTGHFYRWGYHPTYHPKGKLLWNDLEIN